MEVNRTAFYAWRSSEPTSFEEQDADLAPMVRIIFKKHRRRYGARRIASELRDNGQTCSARRVSGVMKTLGSRAIQPKSFVPKTTDSRHRLGYSPNLTQINQIWLGDITYIPLAGGVFCYLALLMDLARMSQTARNTGENEKTPGGILSAFSVNWTGSGSSLIS